MSNNETWYVFDIRSEDVDPRLRHWLRTHGIEMRLNVNGKPPVIASTTEELPKNMHSDLPTSDLLPPKVIVAEPARLIGNPITEALNNFPKLNRYLRKPHDGGFGRTAKMPELARGTQELIADAKVLFERVKESYEICLNRPRQDEDYGAAGDALQMTNGILDAIRL